MPNSPDYFVSIDYNAFKDYVNKVHNTEVGRPERIRQEAAEKWLSRWDLTLGGYFRPNTIARN
jgi:hypothetical protein